MQYLREMIVFENRLAKSAVDQCEPVSNFVAFMSRIPIVEYLTRTGHTHIVHIDGSKQSIGEVTRICVSKKSSGVGWKVPETVAR